MPDLGAKGLMPKIHVRKIAPVVSKVVYQRASLNDPSELTVDVNGSISGTVLNNGVPVEGITCALYFRENRLLIAETKTNSLGRYIFRFLDRNNLKNYYVVCIDTLNTAEPYNYTLVHDHLTPE